MCCNKEIQNKIFHICVALSIEDIRVWDAIQIEWTHCAGLFNEIYANMQQ